MRMKAKRTFALLAGLATLAVCAGSAEGAALVPLAPSTSWGSTPTFASAPPYDGRVFVTERAGGVRVIRDGVLDPVPYLTVPNVRTDSERGLLSIALAPDFRSSGKLYV